MSAIGTRRRGAQARADLPMNAEINVTSLVDVAFTLLVIFMITAPIMQGGLEVDLPEVAAPPIETPSDPLIITIAEDGTVFVAETEIPRAALRESLSALVGSGDRVVIRADSDSRTGLLVAVIGAVGAAGGRSAIATEPPAS